MILPKPAIVLQNYPLAYNTYIMKMKIQLNKHPLPTQFVLVDTYPYRYLLKPFTIVEYKNNILTIIYRIISDGTKFLSTLQQGDKLTICGPYGNTNLVKKLYLSKETKIIFIAGGSGVASIANLYKYLSKQTKNIFVYYGEKTKKYIIDLSILGINNVVYTTDDGSFGKHGLVTDVAVKSIHDVKPEFIFLCGPKGMIKSFLEISKRYPNIKLKCYALMEEYMCCGIGICRSCVVKTKSGSGITTYKTVCKDGPLFDLSKIEL